MPVTKLESRKLVRIIRPALLAILLFGFYASAEAIEISVRDAQTGASVDAGLVAVSLSDSGSKQDVRAQVSASRQNVLLPVGRWQLTFVADGYRNLLTTFESGDQDDKGTVHYVYVGISKATGKLIVQHRKGK